LTAYQGYSLTNCALNDNKDLKWLKKMT
jgi:hypothetical protein